MRLNALAILLACSGCMTVYQPMMSLQRPVAIDPRERNFENVSVLVRCITSDAVDSSESNKLCQNTSQLLTNQGAKVTIEIPGETVEGEEDEPPALRGKPKPQATRPDLIVELSGTLVSNDNGPLNWIFCYLTLTLYPAITDATFEQQVVIKDPNGFLLAQDALQARFVRYFGLAVWAINGLADWLVRPKSERLTGDAPNRDFSKDFQGHISQLVMNAWARKQVLHNLEPDQPGAGQ
jgi:hypothetical protein